MHWRAVLFRSWPIEESALAGPNHFNLLRLAAAGLVLFSHSFHLLDRRGEEPVGAWFNWFDASILGVSIFFFISGFLVCRSWDARRDPVSFLTARALRIAPAYWCVLLLTAALLGPVFTSLPVGEFLLDARTLKYVGYGAVVNIQYLLPGVFEHAPAPGVNGSLWTIRLEVALYLMLAIAGALALQAEAGTAGGDARWWAHPAVRGGMVILWFWLLVRFAFAAPGYYHLAGYFLFGAVCYRYRALCPLRIDVALLLVGAAIGLGRTSWGPIAMPLAVGYLVLTVALHPALRTRAGWLHRNDYSYGLYLYGFPVQQSLVALGIAAPLPLFASALLLTLCCAGLSWHLLEHPILARKDACIGRLREWAIFRA